MNQFTDIRVEYCDHGIAKIIFARGHLNNTSRPEGLAEICEAMNNLNADNKVSVIVLAADGEHFSPSIAPDNSD